MKSFISSFFILFFFIPSALFAGTTDSLQVLLAKAKTNQEKLDITIQLSADAMTRDFKSALEYGQRATYLAKVIQDPEQEIKAYKQLATVFFYAGMIDQAIPNLVKCREFAIKSNNEIELLNANMNLGVMHLGVENYKKALEVFLEGDSLIYPTYKKMGKPVPAIDLTVLYTNIGLSSIMLGQLQEGYMYLQKATEVINANKNLPELLYSKVLQAYGVGLTKEKKADSAILKINQAGSILQRLGDSIQLIGLNSFLAQAYEVKGDYAAAIKVSNEGYTAAIKMNSLYLKKQFAEALYRLYETTKNADSSYKYLKLFNSYKEEEHTLNAKEELFKQELLKAYSEKEKQLLQEERKRRLNIRYLLAGAIFVIAIIFWMYLIKQRKYSRVRLQAMKFELDAERLAIEKELLQAKLETREARIEELTYRLSTNSIKENLVTELQHSDKPILSIDEEVKPISGQQAQLWKDFEVRFLQAHTNFYDKLLAVCPDLTLNERRLCAFLKMDMSTKEISVITGQSVRSINMARFRLRKKLNLTNSETSLFEFLASI